MARTQARVSTYLNTALLSLSACLLAIACGGSGSNAVQPPGVPVLYGDGSGGALAPAVSGSLAALNTQFSSITIPVGVTLTVPSGTVLRSTGPVVIGGTLEVSTGEIGGEVSDDTDVDATTLSTVLSNAGAGVSRRAAGVGEFGDTTDDVSPGLGGVGLGASAQFLRFPGALAGGSGAGSPGNFGGAGGGGLTLLAHGAITITGAVTANGGGPQSGQGGGGGAGGVVVMASTVSVTLTGTISAVGSAGGGSGADSAPGGGGGGGVVILISPLNAAPTLNVLVGPGLGGPVGTPPTAAFRRGGAGGGACGGDGGNGGSVDALDVATAGAPGGAGLLFNITGVDPNGLLP